MKIIHTIKKYRELLKLRLKRAKGTQGRHFIMQGNKTKNRILDFYLTNGHWPRRQSDNEREASLGTRFENYIAFTAPGYDNVLRRIVVATGRKSNNKRKHNVALFKQEILTFIAEHGRVPSTSYQYETIPGEARLRHKLDYYTKDKNDMTLLGQIYDVDKCHLSGIPVKFRPIINDALDVEKPLIRLVK